jgi:hypothetical protein
LKKSLETIVSVRSYEEMTQFESLANELLLDLFEFFHSVHLLQSFIGLNSRFHQLLYSHFQSHQLNLQSLSKEHFDNICNKHLPLIINQLISLRLSDDETPNLSKLLFSPNFTLDRFIRLQSISLYTGDVPNKNRLFGGVDCFLACSVNF